MIVEQLKFCIMKTNYFTIPEITVTYKDKVKASERATIQSSADAAKILAIAFEDCMEHHEEFSVLFLNRANRVLGISCISKGGMSETVVDVRIILQIALKVHCHGILISHNHPSGSIKPSHQDIKLTNSIKEGCKAIGIQLLDHLIIIDESYSSFADEGLL